MFSVVFWFGDLNYRIDLPCETVRNLIETKKYHEMIESDQVYTKYTLLVALVGRKSKLPLVFLTHTKCKTRVRNTKCETRVRNTTCETRVRDSDNI